MALTRRPGTTTDGTTAALPSPASGAAARARGGDPAGVPSLRDGSVSPGSAVGVGAAGPGRAAAGGRASTPPPQGGEAPAVHPAAFDLLLGNGGDVAAAEAGMRTALMGLVWPDAESCAKATGVCR